MPHKSGFDLVLENLDFRRFADTLSVIIFAYSDNHKYIYVNPAFEKALGYSLAELLQMNFWDVCHPDYKDLVRERGQARLRREAVPSNYEIRALRKDGSDLWVDVFFSVAQVAGKMISVVGAYDITERKRLQEALVMSRDRLEICVQERTLELSQKNLELTLLNRNLNTVVMNMSDGVIFLHQNGDFELLNPGFHKSWQESHHGFEENFRDWCRDPGNKYMKRLFVAGKAFQEEEIVIPMGGTVLRFLASGTPILSGQETINTAVLLIRPIKEVHHLVSRLSGYTARFHFKDIITCNPHMNEVIDVARIAARNVSNVLIEGESGTGKELFAQAIHNASPRSAGAFVALNCGAIPRELIASELFGYNEGAFTGAKKGGNPGKFELADGGTLFLDEIGDMPLELQVALLRAIQEKSIGRIGSNQIIPVDVRIICATNKNLIEEMQKGNFRQDLFYRLNVINLHILPLRERPEDIPLLFRHFMRQLNAENNQPLGEDLKNSLLNYGWPGNVRELQNVVERMVNLDHLTDRSLSLSWQHSLPPREKKTSYHFNIQQAQSQYKNERVEQERHRIIRLLQQYDGNVSRVAKEMGISRSTLYRKMKNLSGDKT